MAEVEMKKIAKLEDEMKNKEERIVEMELEINTKDEKIEKLERKIARRDGRIAKNQRKTAQMQETLKKLEEIKELELEKKDPELVKVTDEIETTKKTIFSVIINNDALKRSLNILASREVYVKEKEKQLEEELEGVRNMQGRNEEDVKRLEKENYDLKEDNLCDEFEDAERSLGRLQRTCADVFGQLDIMKPKMDHVGDLMWEANIDTKDIQEMQEMIEQMKSLLNHY